MDTESSASINRHYGQTDYSQRILTGLRQAGLNIDALTRDDLAAFEEFHIGGRKATRRLADLTGLTGGMHLLDVGSGIGGPARTLAAEYGCSVTGIDLTIEFCRAAQMLTERVGLQHNVKFVQGSAVDMPFEDDSFDVVWTQHTAMNIKDKERLYRGFRRLLRPGGKLALHDIMAGTESDLHFPVLWASDAAISFLLPPNEVRRLLESTGFTTVEWVDMTAAAVEF